MGLKDLDIKKSYLSCGTENIADAFLVPALKCTKVYRRCSGFFSSSVLESIMDGIVSLVRNDGKIQLIASPRLNEEDIRAISLGYASRGEIIDEAFSRDFISEVERLDETGAKLLYELISLGTLDIRIAVTESNGIYHDKLGILEDSYGDVVVFYGSANATRNGYQNNYEKIRTVKSWVSADAESVADEKKEFESLWNGTNPFVKVYPYKDSAKKHLLAVIERKQREGTGRNAVVKLRDYQEEAIAAWVNNDYHGFYVMATGTGKTWTAIYSAKRLLEDHSAMVVICAPYKHLVRQWAEDVERAIPDGILILVSSENSKWQQELTEAIVRQKLKPETKIIIISTIVSFNLDRFQKTLKKSKQDKLLVVDEAHRFTNRPESLKEQFKYLLGLSATPFSGKNMAKGEELMAFFGGQVYNLPIESAMDRKFLVQYYYHPIFVNATADEEEQFHQKSALIASCFRNGVCIDPENLALHLRARLRIISMAQEKIDRIKEILTEVKERDHFIVYCGDGKVHDDNDEELRHIQFVKRRLSELGYHSSQFTASETMAERMDLVESFNEGAIDALAAIRCLDEGINIPSIKGALILSSNDDYREFVQRRGRILRTYKDKPYANIYDVIVLPSVMTRKMAEIELRRFYEYARLALNQQELLLQLESLASEYDLELEDFITTFDEGKEAALDD